jgi:hypothetical protein
MNRNRRTRRRTFRLRRFVRVYTYTYMGWAAPLHKTIYFFTKDWVGPWPPLARACLRHWWAQWSWCWCFRWDLCHQDHQEEPRGWRCRVQRGWLYWCMRHMKCSLGDVTAEWTLVSSLVSVFYVNDVRLKKLVHATDALMEDNRMWAREVLRCSS